MLWSLADPRPDGAVVIEYPYFEQAEPMVWDEDGTYVTTDVAFVHTVSPTSGTTGWARWSPPCSRPGW